jgi:hypothetical protein
MSSFQNDNQWSQQPEGPTQDPDFGSRIATFDDVFSNLSFTANLVFKPGPIIYYIAHMVVGGGLYMAMIFGIFMSMGMWEAIQDPATTAPPEPELGPIMVVAMIFIFFFVFILGALGMGPIHSIRKAARGDMQAVDDIGTTFKQSLRAGFMTIPVLFIVYMLTLLGLIGLIVGSLVVGFFLSCAVYLVVTDQAGTFGALGESFRLAKKHAGAVGALFVAVIGGYVVMFGVNLCLGFIPIIGSIAALFIQLAMSVFFLVVYIATMLTIDSAENGWRLGHAHDGIEQVFE